MRNFLNSLNFSIEKSKKNVMKEFHLRKFNLKFLIKTLYLSMEYNFNILFSHSKLLVGCSAFVKRLVYDNHLFNYYYEYLFCLQSKEAGIRTLVMLDEQGGKNKLIKKINKKKRSNFKGCFFLCIWSIKTNLEYKIFIIINWFLNKQIH